MWMKKTKKIVALIFGAALICVLFIILGRQGAKGGESAVQGNIRIGALKGPTLMGLLFMMEKSEENYTPNKFDFQMAAAADELFALMVKGELDIALIPANMASILYNKTDGGVCVIDINTLGVLYMVSGNTEIKSFNDLSGKTIYLTGKGTTPDYVLQYLLKENDMDPEECVLEYKSEAAEAAALAAMEPDAVGLLPQPFATAACARNKELSVVLSMNEEWNKAQGGKKSGLVTGVTVVRRDFLERHEAAVKDFLAEHAESVKAVNEDAKKGAALCVKAGIVDTEAIAQKAIPECNITCITGEEMKQALSGYLQVLFEQSPQSVGGTVPEEDFYYLLSE